MREAARALTGFKPVISNGHVTGVEFDPDASRRRDQDDLRPDRQLGLGGRAAPVRRACRARSVPRREAVVVPDPSRRSASDDAHASGPLATASPGRKIAPLVRRILDHPHLYSDLDTTRTWSSRPWSTSPGSCARSGAPIDRRSWVSLTGAAWASACSTRPSVAGWDWGPAWMSTNAMRVRFVAANELLRKGGAVEVAAGTRRSRAARPTSSYALAHRVVGRPARDPPQRARAQAHDRELLAAPEATSTKRAATSRQRRGAPARAAPPADLRPRQPALLMPRPNAHRACEDFHRTVSSERHREVGVSRRQFISLGVGAGLSIYAARRPAARPRRSTARRRLRRRRPTRRSSSPSSCPAGSTCSTRWSRSTSTAPTARIAARYAQPDVTTPKLGQHRASESIRR